MPSRGSAGHVKAHPPTVGAGTGSPSGRRRPPTLPPAVLDELKDTAGSRRLAPVAERLASARRAFQRERYQEARAVLAPLAREVPDSPAVRELLGLTLYRLERWRSAATELEAYQALAGSADQLPVLADCYRALRRYRRVDELWTQLREASPSAAVVAEGRIVAAGALADQGDLQGALALLERVPASPRVVREHHLRQWYALADLYDRAGDAPRARTLFRRIRDVDPSFADVSQRIANLR